LFLTFICAILAVKFELALIEPQLVSGPAELGFLKSAHSQPGQPGHTPERDHKPIRAFTYATPHP
jgi:hypothetical protein